MVLQIRSGLVASPRPLWHHFRKGLVDCKNLEGGRASGTQAQDLATDPLVEVGSGLARIGFAYPHTSCSTATIVVLPFRVKLRTCRTLFHFKVKASVLAFFFALVGTHSFSDF